MNGFYNKCVKYRAIYESGIVFNRFQRNTGVTEPYNNVTLRNGSLCVRL